LKLLNSFIKIVLKIFEIDHDNSPNDKK